MAGGVGARPERAPGASTRRAAAPPVAPGGGRHAEGDAPAPARRILYAALAGVAAAALALGLHTRPFLLTHIRVSGLRQVTGAEVQVDIGLRPGTFTWQVRPWVVVRRLLRDPMIASARASIRWPDGMDIAIQERLPAALVAVSHGAWEVDAHGRLLRYLPGPLPAWGAPAGPRAVPGLPSGLAVITGVSLGDPVAGQPSRAPGLSQALEVALGLGGSTPGIGARLSWSRGRVYLLTRGGMPVDFGDGSQARVKAEILLGILQVAAREKVRLAAVDVSAPATPAARLKVGSPPLVYDGQSSG